MGSLLEMQLKFDGRVFHDCLYNVSFLLLQLVYLIFYQDQLSYQLYQGFEPHFVQVLFQLNENNLKEVELLYSHKNLPQIQPLRQISASLFQKPHLDHMPTQLKYLPDAFEVEILGF